MHAFRQTLPLCKGAGSHTNATAGHMGIKKTASKITEHFMWPGIIKDVKDLVCCLLLINVTL